MLLTEIGAVQLALGIWLLLRGSVNQTLAFLLVSSAFGGSASIELAAINSAIQPFQVALAFLLLRILWPSAGYLHAVPSTVTANLSLVLFTVFGIAMAYVGPRIFAGTINVVPLTSANLRHLLDSFPLRPTNQNLTTAFYLLGGLLTVLSVHLVCRFRGGAATLVGTGIWLGAFHALVGALGVLLVDSPAEVVFDFFRNNNYAQLDHAYQGFVRMRGIHPEASGYAAFGFAWMVFNAECWYRDIRSRATGTVALMLAGVLLFSTSSTAYVGLAAYLAFLLLRIFAAPGKQNKRKLSALVMIAFAGFVLSCLAVVLLPGFADEMWDMLLHMTVEKDESDSAVQRQFWAMQGWRAFIHSYGLGIGPGSFRSSSLLLAILGSVGILGTAAFLHYLWKVVAPLRASTWNASEDVTLSLAGAAACAALLSLVPAAIGAPSPVPGTSFLIFAAAALALRQVSAEQHRSAVQTSSEKRLVEEMAPAL